MSYLAPPPMPAPVIVTKDVGGYVADYEAQTAIYRATGRDVRLHECRSACTLALSLPNACVYPDSILKFHLAYDPRNRQPNAQVSQQLFDSYPAAVRARLGTLTREYKVLRGSELIALGIRDCNEHKEREPRILTASAPAGQQLPNAAPQPPKTLFAGLIGKMLSVFGSASELGSAGSPLAASLRLRFAPLRPTGVPMPPLRPEELIARDAPAAAPPFDHAQSPADMALLPRGSGAASRSANDLSLSQESANPGLRKLITGAQPILPAGFTPFAELQS